MNKRWIIFFVIWFLSANYFAAFEIDDRLRDHYTGLRSPGEKVASISEEMDILK